MNLLAVCKGDPCDRHHRAKQYTANLVGSHNIKPGPSGHEVIGPSVHRAPRRCKKRAEIESLKPVTTDNGPPTAFKWPDDPTARSHGQ
jgi:hypothetical protein